MRKPARGRRRTVRPWRSCSDGRFPTAPSKTLPVEDPDAVYWDRELLGFGVRVYPTGAKVYVVQTRADGRSKRVTVGRHGVISASQARRRAALIIARIKAGQDPVPARIERTGETRSTVAELADRFLREHVAVRCKPWTMMSYRGALAGWVLPALGSDASRGDRARACRGSPLPATQHPLPGQPGARDPEPDVQPRRSLGHAEGGNPPLPIDSQIPGAQPGAVPVRGGVSSARTGARSGRGGGPRGGTGIGQGPPRWRPSGSSC